MIGIFRIGLLAAVLSFGQTANASPQDDARLIASHTLKWDDLADLRVMIKQAFTEVYLRSISDEGVTIADADKFNDLIPVEDTAPYIERLLTYYTEIYLKSLSPKQLSIVAAALKADENLTVAKILTSALEQERAASVEKARANSNPSGSDDPLILGLEELNVQLKGLTATLEGEQGDLVGAQLGITIGSVFAVLSYVKEIEKLERPANDPVTIAAIKTPGVLKFANPVQRDALLRELVTPETPRGLRFAKPLTDRDGAD